jgi:hypothetical protein
MTRLRSITYVSTAMRAMNPQDLEALLTAARDFNRDNAITGVLLYSGSNFMQCFEGPDDAVQSVYARVLGSSKHKDVTVMMDEPIERRAFNDWLMGSAKATDSELLKLSTAQWSELNGQASFPPAMPPGMGMLQVFWGMRPAADWQPEPGY